MSKRVHSILLALTIALILIPVLMMNHATPLMMDDYDYSFSWATGQRLSGIPDILASQAAHYRLWGGRSVVHFLAQLFLYWGKPVFNVANSLMYLLLLCEMSALAGKRGQGLDWRMLLIGHALLMVTVPFFGTVFLWLDGACNYLWGTALALLPLLILKSEREGGFFDAGFSRGILALPLCLLAGWTNENTACGVWAAMLLCTLWDRIRGRRVRTWRWAALTTQAIGIAVMLLAPGNFARAAGEASRGLIGELMYRFAVTTYCLLRYAGLPALLVGLALLAANRQKAVLRWDWMLILAGAALLSACALVGSPQISDRSFTAVVILVIAVLLAVISDLNVPKAYGLTAGLILSACLIGVSFGAIRDVRAHASAWAAQTDRMETAAAAGEKEVCISSVPSTSRFTMAIALAKEPDAWPNSTLGKYYGIGVRGEGFPNVAP